MDAGDIMDDGAVAALVGISKDTLQRRLRKGLPDGADEVDFRRAQPVIIGGKRRWLRERVEKVIREAR